MGHRHSVNYVLTEHTYNRYEELLLIQGVTVKKLKMDIHEDLERGTTVYIISGDLHFDSVLFPFSITKKGDRFEMNVEFLSSKKVMDDGLMQVLLNTFPQPERATPKMAQPERVVNRAGQIGCLFVWIVIVSVLGLAVVGFLSLFRHR